MRSSTARPSIIRASFAALFLCLSVAALAVSTEMVSFGIFGRVGAQAPDPTTPARQQEFAGEPARSADAVPKAQPSANGRFVFALGDLPLSFPQRRDRLYSISNGGPAQELGSVNDFEPSWAPDGRKIIFITRRDGSGNDGQNRNIYTMNADGTDQRRMSFSGPYVGGEAQPSLSYHSNPNDQRVVFVADYSGYGPGVYTAATSGSNTPVRVDEACFMEEEPEEIRRAKPRKRAAMTPGIFGFDTPNYSPDNNYIIFGYTNNDNYSTDIYRINADGTNCIRLYEGEYDSDVPATARYSRDGTKIALHHREGFPSYAHKLRIINSTTGALLQELTPTNFQGSPVWSPNVGENKIAYIGGSNDPDEPIANLEIRTIDLGSQFEEQITSTDIPEGIRGFDWTATSPFTPSLTLRINQPHPVPAGTSTTGTLTRSTPAPAGGVTIPIQAFNPSGPGQTPIVNLAVSSVFIPEGETQGTFQIDAPYRTDFRTVDIFANSPSPNFGQALATVSVTPARPDLETVSISGPASVAPGASFPLSISVNNIGQETSSAWTDRVYFSTDDQYDASDTLISSFSNSPSLAAGGSRTYSNIPTTIPASVATSPGQFYLILRTNLPETVNEAGRTTNNTAVTTITIELPDLVPENLVLPAVVQPGVTYPIGWTTRNIGTIASGATNSRLYYSPDATFGDANDISLDFVTNNALEPNATQAHNTSFNISTVPARPDGTAYFYVVTDYSNSVYEGLPEGPGENNNTISASTPFEYRVADLQVPATSSPAEVETETVFAMQWTTSNTGNKDAGNFRDRVYFSLDDQVGSDIQIGDFQLSGGLAAGASVERIQNVTIPTSAITTSGNYFVYVRTDAAAAINEGENEENNVRFQPVSVRRLLRPDLVVSNITAPPTAFFDQTIQVQWTVTNNGQGPTNSPQWKDRLYIGTSPISISGASTLADASSVSALNPGESYTASAIVKIPRGLNGALHILVRTNSNGAVAEENTSNNLLSDPIEVNIPPLPDLLVETVQAPDEVFAGQEISINYSIRNIGTEDAGYRKDRIYFSRDTTLNTGQDRLVFTSDSIASPQAGQATSHVSRNRVGSQVPAVYQLARVPSDMEGLWYVFVVADYSNDVYEFTNENNNVNFDSEEPGSPINILVTPPDLVVPAAPTAPATAESGSIIPVAFSVKNQGAFNASPLLYHAVYLSTDNVFDAGSDTLIGSVRDPDFFGPAAEHSFDLTVGLPTCLPNGTYFLFAVADYNGRQFEFDPGFDAEANNASPPQEIQLSTVPPDLQITDLQTSPVTVPGETIAVNWTVTNLGGPTARSWVDRVYLNSTTPGVSRQTIGSFERTGGLASGASYSESRNIQLPTFMEGDYFISVTTDVSEFVAECGQAEDNNTAIEDNFAVQNNLPDLVIDSVSAPSAATVGNSISIEWTGRNANQAMPANSPNWIDYVYLSTDQTLSNGDIGLGGAISSDGPLQAGEAYSKQISATIGNVPAGTYYILVWADGGRTIYEGSSTYENNNVRASGPITLGSPDVDLIASNVWVEAPHYSGTYKTISWTVTNVGTSPTLASTWTDYVILSRDGVIDSTDKTLGYATRNGVLGGGASYNLSANLFIPAGLTGDYRVFVITDRNNRAVESDDANNTSAPASINLTLPPPAELSITNITQPANANVGGNATFTWTVQNTGANAVNGRWRDTVYLSRDQFWDASDVLVGSRDLDSQTTAMAAGGGTYTASLAGALPPVEEGAYYVIVRTDAQNRIRETNEGDNVRTSDGVTSLSITELQLNTPLNTTLANGGQQFFKYATDPGETLLFSLNTNTPARANEAFTKFGTIVSRADYDFQGTRPGEGDQENVVSETQEGSYYSMVRTDFIPESFSKNFGRSPKEGKPQGQAEIGVDQSQNITVQARILPFTVREIQPTTAGNAGYATLWINGAKFREDTAVKLVGSGGVEIHPAEVGTKSATQIVAIFDLRGKAAGIYDVVVQNPDADTSTLDDAFTLVNGGGAAETRSSIRGPSAVRGGTHRFTVSFSNDGLNDSFLVPLVIALPAHLEYEIDQSNSVGDLRELMPVDADLSLLPRDYIQETTRVITLFAPVLASRQSVNVNIDVKVPFGLGFDLEAMALPPLEEWFDFPADISVQSPNKAVAANLPPWECSERRNACFFEIVRGLIFAGITELLPVGCVQVAWKAAVGVSDLIIGMLVKGKDGGAADAVGSLGNLMAGALSGMLNDCNLVKEAIPWVKWAGYALTVAKAIADIFECNRLYDECMWWTLHRVSFPRALDPNEKLGPDGYGAEKFVTAGQPLVYRINFENVSTATAPAQLVRITDTLPPSLDLRTVRLKEIGFKQYRVIVPDGQSFYQGTIQLGDDLNNLQADILAGVDLVNNRVFWNLQALDPLTSQPPLDPFSGLLPPNNVDRDGEGYVIFTVEARSSFPNRTQINNFATIVFDENEPIVTNTTENLLDSVVPTSKVSALPSESLVQDIQLGWSGTDDSDGSGFAGYGVYYSVDGGPYQPFLTRVLDTGRTFNGKWGKSYRFYSIGSDNAGNIELPPTLPDAEITILGGDTEGDVAPRPNGSDGQVDGSDLAQVRRFVAGLDTDYLYNEFQRVDVAPRAEGGNGGLTAADIVQARRYASGLDTRAEAGGPNEAGSFTSKTIVGGKKMSAGGVAREMRVVRLNRVGNKLYAAVEIAAQGDEVAAGFTLNFNPAVLSNPANIQLGTGAGSSVMTVNSSQADQGRLGITLDKGPSDPIPAGMQRLVTLEFDVAAGAPSSTVISFGNTPVFDEVANGSAEPLQTEFTESIVSLSGPTAAGVSISGRVTDGSRGIANALVLLSGPDGRVIEARTNTFGNFGFKGVPAGQTYVIGVRAKRYTFSPRTLNLDSDITGLELSPD